MKKTYRVFRVYRNTLAGYIQIVGNHKEMVYQKEYATLFSWKDANKVVMKLNREMHKNYSDFRFGYVRMP